MGKAARAPKRILGMRNPASEIQFHGDKLIYGKDPKEVQQAKARTEAGRAAAGDAANIGASSDISIRDKLQLINDLQIESGRKVVTADMGSLDDDQLGGRLSAALSNIKNPFFGVAGDSGAYASVKERYTQLVERNRKTKAAFKAKSDVLADQPGRSQVMLSKRGS